MKWFSRVVAAFARIGVCVSDMHGVVRQVSGRTVALPSTEKPGWCVADSTQLALQASMLEVPLRAPIPELRSSSM